MALQYQTLVREITTPTLPTFVTSCLNLIAPKSSAKRADVPASLVEVIFCSFAKLLPHYPTLYRPEASRIRIAAKPYLAPTLLDGFVPSSLKESSRRLVVLLHLAAVKNAGGEEWAKAVRDILKQIHVTADQVFRAVVEDWESTAGYLGEAVDVNQELAGGSNAVDGLPPWSGVYAGIDRLAGLLSMLQEYIKGETSAPVSIPIGAIMDMITRMLSIAMPSSSEPSGGVRLHPAVDRDERDGLWSGIPQIYIAALELIDTIADRLQEGFVSLAPGALDQVTWLFSSGRSHLSFLPQAYHLSGTLLRLVGKSLGKRQTTKLLPIIRSCCRELQCRSSQSITAGSPSGVMLQGPQPPSLHASIHAESSTPLPADMNSKQSTDLVTAASGLLPLLVSHLPQRYLDIPLRSLIERTAVLTHNKDAMLACIMNPFVGKDGRAITGIIPYATKEFGNDATIELLIRPRMPVVPAVTEGSSSSGATIPEEPEDEDMVTPHDSAEEQPRPHEAARMQHPSEQNGPSHSLERQGFGDSRSSVSSLRHSEFSASTSNQTTFEAPHFQSHSLHISRHTDTSHGTSTRTHIPSSEPIDHGDVRMNDESSDSDDESVHLTMELDTDPEESS